MSDNSVKVGSERKDIAQVIQAKLGEYGAEFKKIIWPSRKELIKRTVTVLVTSLMFGVVIFGIDTFFTLAMHYFTILIGK